MYDCHRKSLLYHKAFTRSSPIPFLRVLFPLAFNYRTILGNSEKESFRINYLVNNCGFSPEIASRLLSQKRVTFTNSEKADSVLKLLRDLNLSDSKIRDIVAMEPMILSTTNILPKLEFFRSKGASTSQLAKFIVCNTFSFLKNLENRIIPNYDLMKSFILSDERTIQSILRWTTIIREPRLQEKIELLQGYGVPDSNIARVSRQWPRTFSCSVDDLKKEVEKLKDLGFHPSKTAFIEALVIRVFAKESTWERKVKLYERWGWSNETIREAFIRRPSCMVTSDIKIEAVMDFFVNHLGWDSLVLSKYPILISYSLEKRIIPRGSVLQFLQSKGLVKIKPTSRPFNFSDEMFYQKFVLCFKDEAPQILNLYEEKLNLSR